MAKSKKTAKIGGFSPPVGDRIDRSRRNLVRKRIPWACYSTPYLALIGKRGSVQEPPKCQNLPKCFLATGSRHNEIWRVTVDRGSAIAHHIWPSSVKGGRYRSLQMSTFAQNCGFGHRKLHNEQIHMKFAA